MRNPFFRSLRSGVALLALAPWLLQAAEIHRLNSAESAVELAVHNHPRARAWAAEDRLARAERSQARVLPNPEADVSFLKNGNESHWEFGVMGDVNGLLLYPWKRGTANLRYQAARSRLTAEKSEHALEVRHAWTHAVAASQALALMAQTSGIWDAAAELARRQREAGTLNALDLAEVEAAAVEARLELRRMEAQAGEEKEKLAAKVGLPAANFTLPASLPAPASETPMLDRLETRAAAANASLTALREEAEAARKAHTVSRLEFIPSLKAGVSVERDETGRNFVGPAVSAEIPLFDLGIPKRAQSRAQRDIGRLRAASYEAGLGPQIRAHFLAMTAARDNYEAAINTLIPLRKTATAEALKQYNFMLAGVNRLLSTRRDELAAHKMAVESLRDYWIERAELETLTGGALPVAFTLPPEPSNPDEAAEPHQHGAPQ